MTAKMNRFTTILGVVLVSLWAVSIGQASVMIHITESGDDLVITTSGSIDTTSLGPPGGTTNTAATLAINAFGVSHDHVAFGGNQQDWWMNPVGGAFTFTDGGLADDSYNTTAVVLTSGGGDVGFRPAGQGTIWLPLNYVSGTPINQVLTLAGESFASIGVEDGDTATFAWGGTNPDSITMAIGSGVPVELQAFTVE